MSWIYQINERIGLSKKGLINIQNMNDNECSKWCIVKYLHSADSHPARIRNTDEELADELDFEEIKFPVKIKGIQKIEK